MKFFKKIKTLPSGSLYSTDLGPVADFGQWLAELEILLAEQKPFATVCAPMPQQKPEAQRLRDRRRYMDWLFRHRDQLRQYCAALLLFEWDEAVFTAIRSKSEALARRFQLPYLVVNSEAEALERAEAALRDFVPPAGQ